MAIAKCRECGKEIIIGIIEHFEEQGVKYFDINAVEVFIPKQNSELGDLFERVFARQFHKCPTDLKSKEDSDDGNK